MNREDDPDPVEQRTRFADRLREAGVSTERFIDVHDEAKGTTNHTQRDPHDPALKGNYGVYGGRGADEDDDVLWLVNVDVDDYPDSDEGDVSTDGLDTFPATFTVESPHTDGESGGHRYYAVRGDVAEAFNDRLGRKNPSPPWGEVRVYNQYCVGPGSQIGKGPNGCDKEWCDQCAESDGGYYRIADDREIAILELEEFVEAIATDYSSIQTEIMDVDPADYEPAPSADVEDALKWNTWIGRYLALGPKAAIGKDDRSIADWRACKDLAKVGVSEDDARDLLEGSPQTKVGSSDASANYWRDTWLDAVESIMADRQETSGGDLPDPSPYGFAAHNGGYGYWNQGDDDEPDTWNEWTNFEIEVESFLSLEDGSEEIELTVHPRHSAEYTVKVPPTAFNEKRTFKSEIACGRTTTFTGGETALAKIKQFVGTQTAPDRRGVRHMGLHGDEWNEWVTPNGTLTADGWVDDADTEFVPREIEAERRWSLSPSYGNEFDQDIVRDILELLPKTRDTERFLPVLGWFYAAPLRPLIHEWEGEFNHFSVSGSTGSGKTSTLSMMWALFGMEGDPLTADDTKFTVQATLGSSNAVPMWFDEFKPSDMADHRVDTFQNELRKDARGGTSQRGRPDGSTYAFHLHAPVVISGEERVQGPAEERRGIFSTFRSATTMPGSANAFAFAKLAGGSAKINSEIKHFDGYDLREHALAYYRWILKQDSDELHDLWRETTDHVNDLLQREDIGTLDDLTEQGLRTVKFGCTLYRVFANEIGVDEDTLETTVSPATIDDAIIYVVTESAGGENRQSHLDTFLAVASRAALEGCLEEDEHFTITYRGQEREQLRINISRAHPKVKRYARDHDVNEDLLGTVGDYRERVKDGEETVPYIRCVDQPSPPVSKCVGIHTATAEDEIDGFERALFTGEPEGIDEDDEDESDENEGALKERATPIRDLEHGGNPYQTVTVTVRDAERPTPENAPAVAGTFEDATGMIDFLSWDDCEAAGELTKSIGQHFVITNARTDTDPEGSLRLDVRHADVKPITAGVAYIPMADAGANARIADIGHFTQQKRIDMLKDAINDLAEQGEDAGAKRADVMRVLSEQGIDPDTGEHTLDELLTSGTITELPNGRYTIE